MSTIITCKQNKVGKHNFFIEHQGKEYYLFCQPYHRGVNIYFTNGVSLNNVLNYKTAKGDHKVIKTMSKMKMYIKYIETEYDIKILKNTIQKSEGYKKKHNYNDDYDYNDDCC